MELRRHPMRLTRVTNVGHHKPDRPSAAAIFGASGGIGSAIVAKLAQDDIHLWAGSRRGNKHSGAHSDTPSNANIIPFQFDLTDEASIAAAADRMRDDSPELIIVATGILTLPDGIGPERSYKKINPESMAQLFELNTIGPALVAKHVLPLLPKNRRTVFAALSARVGSIEDNSLGGWHSYRASKTALNMLLKNFAIELSRTHEHAIVAGLHPGTVDSELSKPFQASVPEGKLFTPEYSAAKMLAVLDRLTPADSGGVFDWAGKHIPA